MMDKGRAWLVTKLVFRGILIFVVLKLGLKLLLMPFNSSTRFQRSSPIRGSILPLNWSLNPFN